MCGGESDSQYGRTALMNAALNGRADCVRLLTDVGADKEARDNVRRRSLLCRGVFSFSTCSFHYFFSSVFLFLDLLSITISYTAP